MSNTLCALGDTTKRFGTSFLGDLSLSHETEVATTSGSEISSVHLVGYGTSYATGATIRALATENWTGPNNGTSLSIMTNATGENGGNGTERIGIDANGDVSIAQSLSAVSYVENGNGGSLVTTDKGLAGNNWNIGSSTLSNIDGTSIGNIAVGNFALQETTTGDSNVAIGSAAIQENTTGSQNVSVGVNANQNRLSGSDNVAFGFESQKGKISPNQPTGTKNISVGSGSLLNIEGAVGSCVAVGDNAGSNITTGNSNTCVGTTAGGAITTGANNVCIGSLATVTTGTQANQIALGAGATTTAANQCVIGDAAITEIRPMSNGTCDLGVDANRVKTVYSTGTDLRSVSILGAPREMSRCRGTLAVPTAIKSFDEIALETYTGHNGLGFVAGAAVKTTATEDWSATARGTEMSWSTNATGEFAINGTERIGIDATGDVSIAQNLSVGASFFPTTYTVATLPTATAGAVIRVSDDFDGPTLAIADGTNFKRVSDNEIVKTTATDATFTPTIGDGTNDFTLSGTNGNYTRVGRLVHIHELDVIWTSKASASGTIVIEGLPYAACCEHGLSIATVQGVTFTKTVSLFLSGTQIKLRMDYGNTELVNTDFSGTGRITLSGSYATNAVL